MAEKKLAPEPLPCSDAPSAALFQAPSPPSASSPSAKNLSHPALEVATVASPVTPQEQSAQPTSSSPLVHLSCDAGRDAQAAAARLLLEGEAATLAMMLQHVTRRKPERTALVARTVAAGNSNYIEGRHGLVDWMIQVCNLFGLMPTTLHTAVRHLDWSMSKGKMPRNVWQLCAVACVLIAAKCEEKAMMVPRLSQVQHVCGGAYNADVVSQMEVMVLEKLKWDPVDRVATHFLVHSLRTVQRMVDSPVVTVPQSSSKRSLVEADRDLDTRATKIFKAQASADVRDSQPPTPADDNDAAVSFLQCRSPASEEYIEVSAQVQPAPVDYLKSYLSGNVLAYGQTAAEILDEVLYDMAVCATQNPQRLAAAALYVARKFAFASPAWPKEYQAATGLAAEDFFEQDAILMEILNTAARREASRDLR